MQDIKWKYKLKIWIVNEPAALVCEPEVEPRQGRQCFEEGRRSPSPGANPYVKKWKCEKVNVWKSESVKKWTCEKVNMWKSESVKTWKCENVKVWKSIMYTCIHIHHIIPASPSPQFAPWSECRSLGNNCLTNLKMIIIIIIIIIIFITIIIIIIIMIIMMISFIMILAPAIISCPAWRWYLQ